MPLKPTADLAANLSHHPIPRRACDGRAPVLGASALYLAPATMLQTTEPKEMAANRIIPIQVFLGEGGVLEASRIAHIPRTVPITHGGNATIPVSSPGTTIRKKEP